MSEHVLSGKDIL